MQKRQRRLTIRNCDQTISEQLEILQRHNQPNTWPGAVVQHSAGSCRAHCASGQNERQKRRSTEPVADDEQSERMIWDTFTSSVREIKNQGLYCTVRKTLQQPTQFSSLLVFVLKARLPWSSVLVPWLFFHRWMATGRGGCWVAVIRERLNAQCSSGWVMIWPLNRYSAAENAASGNQIYQRHTKWHFGLDCKSQSHKDKKLIEARTKSITVWTWDGNLSL